MQTFVALFSLIAISQAQILTAPAPVSQEVKVNDSCSDLLLDIMLEVSKAVNAINDGNINEAKALFLDLSKKMYQEYECLNGAEMKKVLKESIQTVLAIKNDRKDCYVEHLKQAVSKFRDGLFALFHGHFEEFQKDMQEIAVILKDARQTC